MEKRSYCGTEMDNIYTMGIASAVKTTSLYYTGVAFSGIAQKPINRKDSFLINEGTGVASSTTTTTGGGR